MDGEFDHFTLVNVSHGITNIKTLSRAAQGSADPLNSAFHLTYNMVLNLLRVEEINPEYMLEKSFYQFQHYRALPGVVESESLFTLATSAILFFLSFLTQLLIFIACRNKEV